MKIGIWNDFPPVKLLRPGITHQLAQTISRDTDFKQAVSHMWAGPYGKFYLQVFAWERT